MTDEQTAEIAEKIFGEKLYQQRARLALPILVRYAFAQRVVTYEELARQLRMSNARSLNYGLGSIGVTLAELSKSSGHQIHRIALLVVNKSTGMPGRGVDTLRNWGKAGKIKEYRHPANNYRLFLKSDLDAFVGEIQTEDTTQDVASPNRKKPR